MSIYNMLIRRCKQTAIYWGNPVNDGYGKMTFDFGREIKCRWEDATRVVETKDGKEVISTSQIHVLENLDNEGLLYLGILEDLSVEEIADPYTIDGVAVILKMDKIPGLNDITQFVRKVYTSWRAV